MRTFNFFFSFLLALFCALSCHAQDLEHFKYFLTFSDIPVDTPAKAQFIRILSDDGKNVTFSEKYSSGQFRRSGMAASRSKDLHKFQPHGDVKTYYPSGKIARVTRYNKGRIVGNDSCFYENGQLMLVRHCFYSVKDYLETEVSYLMEIFDPSGTAIITQGEGTYKMELNDSLHLFTTKSPDLIVPAMGNVKGGLKEGEWTGKCAAGNYKEIYKGGLLLQGTATLSNGESYNYATTLILPQYGKSTKDFWRDLSAFSRKQYPYPKTRDKIEFIISFYIDESGKMLYPTIEKESEEGMGNRLLNLFSKLKKWNPGRLHGFPFPQRREMLLVFHHEVQPIIQVFR